MTSDKTENNLEAIKAMNAARDLDVINLRRQLVGALTENESLRRTINDQAHQLRTVKAHMQQAVDDAYQDGEADLADGLRAALDEALTTLVRISSMSYAGVAADLAAAALVKLGAADDR